MKVNYNKQGKERKELVKAIETITGEKAVYMKMPTCNYEIGKFTVTKDGGLECENQDLLDQMVIGLITEGFTPEGMPHGQEQTEEADTTGLTVEIPLDKVAVGNLTKILDAKGNLIKKALGISDLRFEIKEDRIAFPWFKEVEPDEAMAYTKFIAALCKMAKDAKRITATEKEVENEKYAFRCFLLRLGFIGADYKKDRKILLKNLTGSAAWKNGGADHEISE